jgi:hypothetical protein
MMWHALASVCSPKLKKKKKTWSGKISGDEETINQDAKKKSREVLLA